MSSAEATPYWLGRTSAEQRRLIQLHYIWTKSIGYLIHPSISPKLPAQARVADLGTGTGIWVAEAAKAYPETYSFDGYDISSVQLLHASALPSNASLGIANFKKPFPAEMHGKYDLLAMRLLGIAIGTDVWVSTLQNILTLLKPGGAIQWVEGNFLEGTRGLRGTAPRSTPGHALIQMHDHFMLELAMLSGYNFPDFTALFTDGGLADVEEDGVSTNRIAELRVILLRLGCVLP